MRVHLDWGQRLAFSFTAAGVAGADPEDSPAASATIRNPVRQVVKQAAGATSTAYTLGQNDTAMSGSTLVPVRYQNRRSSDTDVDRYAVAGDFYLVLTTNIPLSGDTSDSYPYTLQIQVFGAAQGAPAYRAAPGAAPAEDADGGSSAGRIVSIIAMAAGVAALGFIVLILVARRRATRQARSHT